MWPPHIATCCVSLNTSRQRSCWSRRCPPCKRPHSTCSKRRQRQFGVQAGPQPLRPDRLCVPLRTPPKIARRALAQVLGQHPADPEMAPSRICSSAPFDIHEAPTQFQRQVPDHQQAVCPCVVLKEGSRATPLRGRLQLADDACLDGCSFVLVVHGASWWEPGTRRASRTRKP